MVSNGWRERYFYGELRKILVVTCKRCHRYDRLLPADVCAYRDATLDQVEVALSEGPLHAAGAPAAGQVGFRAARRFRRWHRGLNGHAHVLKALLPAVPGTWLARVHAVVCPGPGALIRVRVWLWDQHRIFFAVPTGLFRHGRLRTPRRPRLSCPSNFYQLRPAFGSQFLRLRDPV